MQRRSLFAAALGLLTLAFSQATLAAEPLKIGFIYPGPIADVGWTTQHELGRKLVEKTYGDKVKTYFVENVPETADAARVVRQLINQGCTMIFTTSFGYMEATAKLAKQFPKVSFDHATGYKMDKNLGIYQTRFYQGAYLMGVLAGKMTKSNTLGFVGSHPIPEVLRNINAFTIGARSVNPNAQTKVIWISSWYDPPKEREAAETLVSQGADVLYQNTDSPAAVQVAEKKGLYAFGQDSDMSKYGPRAHLSANTVNWGVYYVKKVGDKLAGKWKPEDTAWGMKEGMIEVSPLGSAVPADVAKIFTEKKEAVASGKLEVFAGPLKDNAAGVKVPAGSVLPEKDLWSLTWYVEGVQGSIPK
ncbi:BMP family ABC transporter substrate-binding protein [Viridibacterium curvum]|uniref:BMP family ABC transporter substrate-binding protein n=1 Tax=Viridibacterium curvum TaxID=1101404 RepID=A0ABP9QPK5_9RHOO